MSPQESKNTETRLIYEAPLSTRYPEGGAEIADRILETMNPDEARNTQALEAAKAAWAVTRAIPDPSSLLTSAEVAARLRCSRPHVRKLWDNGILPAILIAGTGKRRRMRRMRADDLEQFIARHRTGDDAA